MKNLFLVLFVLFAFNSFAQEKNFIDQNYIEVTGKAEMEVVPDEIYLKIIVEEDDFKGKQAIEDVEKNMLNKLTGLGVDVSKQLVIKDMASNFKKYWLKGQKINSAKEYQLKVEKAQMAGLVIQELATLGISNVTIDKVDHSEIQKYRTEVKVNAVKAAKEKAVALTGAIGQKAGKAIYMEEINNNVWAYQGRAAGLSNIVVKACGVSDEMEMPEIEFEKIKLEYSVLVRFSIE